MWHIINDLPGYWGSESVGLSLMGKGRDLPSQNACILFLIFETFFVVLLLMQLDCLQFHDPPALGVGLQACVTTELYIFLFLL